MFYKKMIIMNLFGAIAWVLLGIALYPSKLEHHSLNLPLSAILLYAMIVAVPLKTAFVFFQKNKKLANSTAQVLNFALAIFFVFSYINILVTESNVDTRPYDIALLISLFLIVVPALLNIKFLRKLSRG
jgi:membrane protein DedA with SNARE-associated domain